MSGKWYIRVWLSSLLMILLFVADAFALTPNDSIKRVYSQIVDPKTGELIPFIVLDEVVILPKKVKQRYSRKNNPAVELLRNVIANKQNNSLDTNMYKVKEYEKLTMHIEPFDFDLNRNRVRREFKFLEKYVDTLNLPNQRIPVLPISIRERLSVGPSVNAADLLVYGRTWAGMDRIFEQGTLDANIRTLFRHVDVRHNNLDIMTVQFISPLSSTQAELFYQYYILDTLKIDGRECIDLAFVPVNSAMLSFMGHLYIVNDSSYAVRRCVMNVNSDINLNWISSLRITQDFHQMADKWEIAYTRMETNFTLSRYMRHSVYAKHQAWNYLLTDDEVVDTEPIDSAAHRTFDWWQSNRPVPLAQNEQVGDSLLKELHNVPSIRRGVKTFKILREGYIPTSADLTFENSYWDFGPILNTVSFNGVEGWRVRVGGMTTAKAHPNCFFEGYAAYGFSDKRPKGAATLTYSFNKKEHYVNEQLHHALSLFGSYDIEVPGSRYAKITRDNILLSIDPHSWFNHKRWNTKGMYVTRGRLTYERQFQNSADIKTWLEYERCEAAGSMNFATFQDVNLNVAFSFSPDKLMYNDRSTITNQVFRLANRAPEFSVSSMVGYFIETKKLYNITELSAKYRLWMSQFGYIDMFYKAGILSSKQIPYVKLFYPSANQSLLLSQHSFNMMRDMEFAMDKYVSWFLTYHINGLVMNRIPYLNKLKLRGVVSFSGIYGHLSDSHYFEQVNPISHTMPYMEMTVGIENIFRLFRIDYVRRLSYNDGLTGWQKNGIKVSVGFNF